MTIPAEGNESFGFGEEEEEEVRAYLQPQQLGENYCIRPLLASLPFFTRYET